MNWIYWVDIFGTGVFAISGVLTAIQKKFDLVGSLVIGFVAAIGGGTLRDLLLGDTPVNWLQDRNYFIVIVQAYFLAYIFREQALGYKRSMFLFDTIGIGLFTILGIQKATLAGLHMEYCLILGVVSACFGGVIRDVLTNEVPLIFRREIYATACFAGGIVYIVLERISHFENLNILLSIGTVFLIRYFSVKRGWSLNVSLKE